MQTIHVNIPQNILHTIINADIDRNRPASHLFRECFEMFIYRYIHNENELRELSVVEIDYSHASERITLSVSTIYEDIYKNLFLTGIFRSKSEIVTKIIKK